MLINDVSPDARSITFPVIISKDLLTGSFEESTKSFEKSHDFRFGKNVRENFKICTKLAKSIEVHQVSLLVSIESIKWNHGSMHTSKYLNYLLIFEDVHQVNNLVL